MKRRICAFVDETMFVEQNGYRVAIVTENEPGYQPTGTWPYHGKVGQTMPYFFGRKADGSFSLEAARQRVVEYNRDLGVSPEDANEIIASSMRAQIMRDRV